MATGEGAVHAYNSDISEVPGWPVRATSLPLHEGSEAFKSGTVGKSACASISGTPAVETWTVTVPWKWWRRYAAGFTPGRGGRAPAGFPGAVEPVIFHPRPCGLVDGGALPAEWFASRIVPDRVHKLDGWNRLGGLSRAGRSSATLMHPSTATWR